MGLKLAISGKGGVGKTTLAGTLARLFAADGHRVLAIDADPDANLAETLGMPAELRGSIRTIAEDRRLIEERTGAKVQQFGQLFRLNPDVSGIAETHATRFAGVDLIVLGAAGRAGGGCACPESVLLKSLVRQLVLDKEELVILDMEAGIEHLGRGTAMGVDLMIAVVEPGQRSVDSARRIRQMAGAIGIRRFAVVLNKLVDREADARWLEQELDDISNLGTIPYDQRIARADRTGQSLVDLGQEDLLEPFRGIQQTLIGQE